MLKNQIYQVHNKLKVYYFVQYFYFLLNIVIEQLMIEILHDLKDLNSKINK
jgi:hypothetical protein